MSWLLISTVDNTIVDGPFTDPPEPGENERVVEVAIGYPTTCFWSPESNGFIDLPPGATTPLDAAKHRKWESIKAIRDVVLRVATTPFGQFDSDDASLIRINGQIAALDNMTALGMTPPAEIIWKRHTNDFAELTPTEFRQLGLYVAQHISNTFGTSWLLEQQITAATTIEDVEAIAWPS